MRTTRRTAIRYCAGVVPASPSSVIVARTLISPIRSATTLAKHRSPSARNGSQFTWRTAPSVSPCSLRDSRRTSVSMATPGMARARRWHSSAKSSPA